MFLCSCRCYKILLCSTKRSLGYKDSKDNYVIKYIHLFHTHKYTGVHTLKYTGFGKYTFYFEATKKQIPVDRSMTVVHG